MRIEYLKKTITSGRVTSELLPQIFDDDLGIAEEYRLKAVSITMRNDPQLTRPYFLRLNPERLVQSLIQNLLEPSLITLALRAFPDSKQLFDAALDNTRTPTQALLLITEKASENQLAKLVNDELRLILAPELMNALLRNEKLDGDQKKKLNLLEKKIANNEQLRVRAALRPESFSLEDLKLLVLEKENDEKATSENIYARLGKMTAAEKALLAINGNRNVRLILVRDPNSLVARAVMRSSRLTESDIEAISQMREVDEEILRILSSNRRWMRKYNIMKHIALNPRSPVVLALSLIGRLSNTDVRTASRDHNLNSVVKKAVGKIARNRGLR